MAYVGEPLKDEVSNRKQNAEWLRVYHSYPGTPKAAWAKDRLVRGNQRLLRSVVVKTVVGYPHWRVYFEDICQEAQFGLLRAIDLFDCSKGYAFSTYAYQWIRHFAQVGLATTTIIRKPFSLWEIKRWAARFEAKVFQEQGRKPTIEEISAAINASNICSNYVMTPEKYTLMLSKWFQGTMSLDYEAPGDKMGDNNTMFDYLIDPREVELETSELGDWLRDLAGGHLHWKLNVKERSLLSARLEGLTIKDAAERYGWSDKFTRSLNHRLVRKIHHARAQHESGAIPTNYREMSSRPSRPPGGKSGIKNRKPRRDTCAAL